MKFVTRRTAVFASTLAALAVVAFASGCGNDGSVVGAAQESPTPTATPPSNPEAPVAVIDSGSPIYSTLDTATFDGFFSYDPDGYIVSYAWEIAAAPAGSTAAITPDGFDGSTSTLFLDLPGNYSVKLTVTDNDGLTGSTTYDFSATPSNFHVQLTWPNQYTQADMDLHVIDTTATTPAPQLWDDLYDCHWRNCKPSFGDNLDWGVANVDADNPRLDIDNIEESVPENMNIETPVDGTYHIAVHYYGSHVGSDIPVDANVNIWIAGTLVYTTSATMTATNQVWNVADVMWSNTAGTVTPDGTMSTTTPPGF